MWVSFNDTKAAQIILEFFSTNFEVRSSNLFIFPSMHRRGYINNTKNSQFKTLPTIWSRKASSRSYPGLGEWKRKDPAVSSLGNFFSIFSSTVRHTEHGSGLLASSDLHQMIKADTCNWESGGIKKVGYSRTKDLLNSVSQPHSHHSSIPQLLDLCITRQYSRIPRVHASLTPETA